MKSTEEDETESMNFDYQKQTFVGMSKTYVDFLILWYAEFSWALTKIY